MSRSQISQDILMSAEAIAQADTHYSLSRKFHSCTGSAAVFIISTAGSVTITQQCSMDNVTWYDPVDTSGTALGGVRAALTVTAGVYVPFSPVLCEFIRFKVVEQNSAATAVTLKLLTRVEV
jgi:hypothetical protein